MKTEAERFVGQLEDALGIVVEVPPEESAAERTAVDRSRWCSVCCTVHELPMCFECSCGTFNCPHGCQPGEAS